METGTRLKGEGERQYGYGYVSEYGLVCAGLAFVIRSRPIQRGRTRQCVEVAGVNSSENANWGG